MVLKTNPKNYKDYTQFNITVTRSVVTLACRLRQQFTCHSEYNQDFIALFRSVKEPTEST